MRKLKGRKEPDEVKQGALEVFLLAFLLGEVALLGFISLLYPRANRGLNIKETYLLCSLTGSAV